MEVAHDGGDAGAQLVAGQQLRRAAERAVQRVHEQPAHRVQHQRLAAVPQRDGHRPGPRRARREVERADNPGLLRDVGDQLLAVPGVVAQRDRVGAGGQDGFGHVGRQAEAVAGVLAVDHHQVGAQVGAQLGQAGGNGVTAGAADDVAQEQDSHVGVLSSPGLSWTGYGNAWGRVSPHLPRRPAGGATSRTTHASHLGSADHLWAWPWRLESWTTCAPRSTRRSPLGPAASTTRRARTPSTCSSHRFLGCSPPWLRKARMPTRRSAPPTARPSWRPCSA